MQSGGSDLGMSQLFEMSLIFLVQLTAALLSASQKFLKHLALVLVLAENMSFENHLSPFYSIENLKCT